MDVTFWVIQVVLLAPVLFMAASASKKDESDGRRSVEPHAADTPARRAETTLMGDARAAVSVPAADNLSEFSVEEQARLVLLRCLVQDARQRGSFADDSRAADDEQPVAAPGPTPMPLVSAQATKTPSPRRGWKGSTQLVLAAAALMLAGVGLTGVAHTSGAIDRLQHASLSRTASVSPATRLLPGMIADPARYMSALSGGGPTAGPGSATSDPLFDAAFVNQKQAMDRWEALIAIGLSLLLFVKATRAAPVHGPALSPSEDGAGASSVASDLAPFVLVAAVLFAGLSFFEMR